MPPTWSAPVRYVEADQEGVAFNGHYLTWCDEALPAHFATAGVPLPALAERGLSTLVVSAQLDWRSSAVWGDVVEVRVTTRRIGRTSITLGFDIRVGERMCCEAAITYVMVDDDHRPVPVPDDVRTALDSSG